MDHVWGALCQYVTFSKIIKNIPILSGTFASKSYGPSLSGIDLVSIKNVFPRNVLKNEENENQYKTKKAPPSGRGLITHFSIVY